MTFEYVSHCQLQSMMFVPNVSLNSIYILHYPMSVPHNHIIFNVYYKVMYVSTLNDL